MLAIRKHIHILFLTAGIYLFNVNNRNNRAMCEICSNLTIKTPERRLSQIELSVKPVTFSLTKARFHFDISKDLKEIIKVAKITQICPFHNGGKNVNFKISSVQELKLHVLKAHSKD